VGHVARIVEGRGVYRVLVGRPDGKIPLERTRRRWEDHIKWVFNKRGGDIDWVDMVRDSDTWRALVDAVMSLRVP